MITHKSFLKQLLQGKKVELESVKEERRRLIALQANQQMLERDIELIEGQLKHDAEDE